jgi:hypothetical protein
LIPTKDLEPFLGKLEILSVDFGVRYKAQFEAGLPAADLTWSVHVNARMPGHKDLPYGLTLEPFAGKLVGLIRMSLP